MTTSDTIGGYPAPPPTSDRRLMRRNRTNRVAAGVCSGLGDYFGVDPVLFRVLFATAAFFGGAGILAYLLAWAAIPEGGTAHAPIDGFIGWIRRRRIPLLLVAVLAGLFLWAVAFSWWAPGPFFPVVAVVVLLVVIFTRREMQASPRVDDTTETTVDLTKGETPDATTGEATWAGDARSWFDEARDRSRTRRRRSLPLRLGMLGTLVVTLTVLGLIDAFSGIELQVYFWAALGILGVGLLGGIFTRRTPWSMTPLLVIAILGSIAFAGSHASLHDGIGQREWKPTGNPSSDYRLGFGQGILDLRSMKPQDLPRTINVTVGAGQVQIIAPRTLNMTVLANIHIGELDVDDNLALRHGGVGISRTVSPPRVASGTPITVDVHLTDGNIAVYHR